jgi:hypothetical protein
MKKKTRKVLDPDMQGVGPALLRAAARAREIARKTGTPLVIYEDGKIVKKSIKPQPDDDASGPAFPSPRRGS